MKVFIHLCQALLCLCLLTFVGCKKDELISEEIISIEPTMQAEEFFALNLNGLIVDEDGQAVPDATVVINGEIVSSNENGLFSTLNINAPNTGQYVKVLKEGYFTGGTHYFPNKPSNSGVEITLRKKDLLNFEAETGFETELTGGAKLIIPASGIQRNGQAYNGSVTISTTWLDPEEESTFNTMPGALLAQTEEGETQFLQTFGMIAVEMTDDAGEELQLKEGVKATLEFPLSNSLASSAPESIPLWHFDEVNGIWVEEGQAEKSNGRYMAEVSHFSWWNCDFPYDVTKICLDIRDQRGVIIDNLTPCLSNNIVNSFCNPRGQYCGLVPADGVFTLELRGLCGEVVHTQSIGPFEGTINDLTTVNISLSIPANQLLTFSGTVTNCTGNDLLENGFISVIIEGNEYFDYSLQSGQYEINLINCNSSASEVSLNAYDITELATSSQIIQLVANQTEYETNLSACGNSLSEFFTFSDSDETSITTKVVAYQSVAETLIIPQFDQGQNAGNVLVGFRGFGVGEFSGNVLDNDFFSSSGQGINRATITITRYEDVGGIIAGKYIDEENSGTFIVKRER